MTKVFSCINRFVCLSVFLHDIHRQKAFFPSGTHSPAYTDKKRCLSVLNLSQDRCETPLLLRRLAFLLMFQRSALGQDANAFNTSACYRLRRGENSPPDDDFRSPITLSYNDTCFFTWYGILSNSICCPPQTPHFRRRDSSR